MAEQTHREVSLRRTSAQTYLATNVRGGELRIGPGGDDPNFTAVELLLTAIAACSAADVDILTSRRAEPESFDVDITADKVRTEAGNRLEDVEMVFRVRFPAGTSGDAARALLPDALAKSHDRLCTVSRTVELGTPIAVKIAS
ncbi:MAG TPA: OsmC family protein [Jiangellaceae bacterium]|nr:OsmC family protein [Jiangellaceae bacterium]